MARAVLCSSSRLLLKILELAGKWLEEVRCFSVLIKMLLLHGRSVLLVTFVETSTNSSSAMEMTSTENIFEMNLSLNVYHLTLTTGGGMRSGAVWDNLGGVQSFHPLTFLLGSLLISR